MQRSFCCWCIVLADIVNPQLLLQEPTQIKQRVEEYERQIITEA
ncbi:Phosphoglycerate transport systemtranscriptional regulatory protein PgtA [Salmonella bongori N268-08]|uniref:Phosphoglycerate transport systemtranscriptional regulatory protein PgtA n=1 Tax=Salmonella bongori N268-08 TaxID=1197719 RepID=S5MYM6_SALBN|nr:Phosphoglycerate transport systemtranscriptional regulatory protein PgtA [Salmonella bongori N268-08]